MLFFSDLQYGFDQLAVFGEVTFAVSDNTTLKAQIAKGFRLGGINDPLNIPVCTPEDLVTFGGADAWDDEELWN